MIWVFIDLMASVTIYVWYEEELPEIKTESDLFFYIYLSNLKRHHDSRSSITLESSFSFNLLNFLTSH